MATQFRFPQHLELSTRSLALEKRTGSRMPRYLHLLSSQTVELTSFLRQRDHLQKLCFQIVIALEYYLQYKLLIIDLIAWKIIGCNDKVIIKT